MVRCTVLSNQRLQITHILKRFTLESQKARYIDWRFDFQNFVLLFNRFSEIMLKQRCTLVVAEHYVQILLLFFVFLNHDNSITLRVKYFCQLFFLDTNFALLVKILEFSFLQNVENYQASTNISRYFHLEFRLGCLF